MAAASETFPDAAGSCAHRPLATPKLLWLWDESKSYFHFHISLISVPAFRYLAVLFSGFSCGSGLLSTWFLRLFTHKEITWILKEWMFLSHTCWEGVYGHKAKKNSMLTGGDSTWKMVQTRNIQDKLMVIDLASTLLKITVRTEAAKMKSAVKLWWILDFVPMRKLPELCVWMHLMLVTWTRQNYFVSGCLPE